MTTPANEGAERRWKASQGVLAFLCLGAMFLTCLAAGRFGKLPVWLANLALAAGFVAFAGKATTRALWGALIDDQNSLSLARLQTTLWTILIGSAFVTAATTNALAGEDAAGPTRQQLADAEGAVEAAREDVASATAQLEQGGGASKKPDLAKRLEELRADRVKKVQALKELEASRHRGSSMIAIPAAVWILLGISLTSLAGSPLILSYKKGQPANAEEKSETITALARQNVDTSKLTSEGQVLAKTELGEAALADLFRGEETGNAARLDLGRVQLFFFTIGVLVAYAIALGTRFATADPIHEFPDLDTSLATLLGVSNAGYLLNKAAPHSETPRSA